ncbi:DUF6302 family protein [Streptomyces sp. NPDC058391]|uniref:DUF6302 family protein n=1 Tax=Streptomyces sp. NPDC058391 TaxID=3346476 RepID=UPI003654AF96
MHTLETDRAWMLSRLKDPTLLDQAVAVPVGTTNDGTQRLRLAVPVGGARHAGFLTVSNYAEALATLSALAGLPGFPSPRVRKAVTAQEQRRTIIWGDDPPAADEPARWRFYGYSDEAITDTRRRETGVTARHMMKGTPQPMTSRH